MGRLDDAAKSKVVELRQAGLSFRKIKAVLELENIKVSAQAIYLFLKEFQGRTRREETGAGAGSGAGPGSGVGPGSGPGAGATQAGTAAPAEGGDGAGRQTGWGDQQVWSLLRDSSRASGYPSPQDPAQQGGTPRGGGRPSGGAAEGSGGAGGPEQQGRRKEDGIRIVSVTSLARGTQHGGPQMAGGGVFVGPGIRRKAPMSPASSAIMVARKRLLDKALLHKARVREMATQPGQQAGQLYGRGQACFQGNDARKVTVLPQTSTLSLASARLPQARGGMEAQPGHILPKRTLQQRVGPPTRSLQPPPSITVRAPNPAPAPPAGQGPGAAPRPQPPPNPAPRKDAPGAPQDGGWRGGLQEQMQALGAEVRGLGMAVRLMVEQQSRVEREQAQQTQVQRQILSTLQALSSALRPAKTPTPPGPAPAPAPAPAPPAYRRDSHTPTRTTYAQCSQPPLSKYCELEGPSLESLEAYKLPGLSSPTVNGFQSCGPADGGLALGPAQTHTHTHTYTPPFSESHAEVFAQTYGSSPYPSQSQTHAPAYSQAYAEPLDYPAPLQGCSPAANLTPDSPLSLSPHEPQLNIIKVETM